MRHGLVPFAQRIQCKIAVCAEKIVCRALAAETDEDRRRSSETEHAAITVAPRKPAAPSVVTT